MEISEEVLGRLKTQSFGSRAAAGNPEQKVPAQTKAELVYGVNTLKRHCFLHISTFAFQNNTPEHPGILRDG